MAKTEEEWRREVERLRSQLAEIDGRTEREVQGIRNQGNSGASSTAYNPGYPSFYNPGSSDSSNRPFENPAIKDYIQKLEDSYKPSFNSKESLSHARGLVDLNDEIMRNQVPLIQSYNDIAFDDWGRYNDKYTESLNWLKDQDRIFTAGENAQDRRLKRDAISSETFMNNENNKYKKYGYDTQLAGSLFGGGNFFT